MRDVLAKAFHEGISGGMWPTYLVCHTESKLQIRLLSVNQACILPTYLVFRTNLPFEPFPEG